MKRFLLPLLAALALPTAVNADYGNDEIMIHRFCTSKARKGIQSYRECKKNYYPQKKIMTFTYRGKTYKQVEIVHQTKKCDGVGLVCLKED